MSNLPAPGGDVLFLGASGLIGALALPQLLERIEGRAQHVFAPARRLLGCSHPLLRTIVAAFDEPLVAQSIEARIRAAADTGAAAAPRARLGAYICCMGTTLRAAGSQAAFAAIDRDLVVRMAQVGRRLGARQAIVVSSVGADAGSSNLYLRTKGEMEAAVLALGFELCDFLRPGLLLGQRSERRAGERIAQSLAVVYNPLLVGPLKRYRAIPARSVALAIVALLDRAGSGLFVHEHEEMERLAAGGHGAEG